MKTGLGWRGYQPKRVKVKADTIRELEKVVNEKEQNNWKLVSKFMKEDVEFITKGNGKIGKQFKPRYENFSHWFCIMQYEGEKRKIV
jgi:hypothetical protein